MERAETEAASHWPPPAAWGLVAALSLLLFGGLLALVPLSTAGFSALLFFMMAIIVLTDLRGFTIPDLLSLPAIPLGLLANAILAPAVDAYAALADGLAGAIIGAGTLYLLRAAYFRFRGVEGMGLGDVKLAAVAGAWLGPGGLAPACLLACVAAFIGIGLTAALRGREQIHARLAIPFGSFIAPAIFVMWMAQVLELVPDW